MAGHPHIERWSLLMHRHIADRIERGDVSPIACAKENLERWKQQQGDLDGAQSEWQSILDGSLPRLLSILRDPHDQEAMRLRGTSPFAGAVEQELRLELLREARAA